MIVASIWNRGGFRWAIRFVCLGLVAMGALFASQPAHAQPFTLQAGSVGGVNYSLLPYDAAGVPGNATFDPFGRLGSPGNGYGTLQPPPGAVQPFTGGAATPSGNLAGGLNTVANPAMINGAVGFGSAFTSQFSNNSGIWWPNFRVTDVVPADNKFSASDSRGIASYTANVNINGQAGLALGVQGFLPAGAQGFASLHGSFDVFRPGVGVVLSADDAVVIAANNGGGLLGFEQNVAVDGPALAANSSSFFNQFPVAGGSGFQAFGVALLPAFAYLAGDVVHLDGMLTLAADPMAELDFFSIPLNVPEPILGLQAAQTPEPSSLFLCASGLLIGLVVACRRRRSAA
jgi:hypothetical protein